ncbi:MAG: type-F conjugative transfer system secretin TraK [Candidatus Omnitrophica bacterium]|nr:type-F conjugative transfer system secretin TraK [Candidatus Omnitrophota bacterium]
MAKVRCSLVLILIFGAVVCAEAQEVKHVLHEGAVEVRSELGKVIEVVVGNGVSSIVRSGDAASLKVEQVSGHLFITPLMRSAAELMVIDGIGRSYRLKFVFDHGREEKVVIAPRENQRLSVKGALSSIDIIRELASGRVPEGAVETVREDVIFEDSRVRIRTEMMYEMTDIVGYILTAENLLPQSQVLPVEQFNFPGLLAVNSQRDILSPAGTNGSKGILYMVATR